MRSREEVEFLPDDDLTEDELARRQADNAQRKAAAEASEQPQERHWPEDIDPLNIKLRD
jgi:hypothetical protein